MYYDANNLYGWSMSQPLPTGLMCWLDEDEIRQFDHQKMQSDDDKGYMLEVDLEYPHQLHNDHNSYPLAPSHKQVEDDVPCTRIYMGNGEVDQKPKNWYQLWKIRLNISLIIGTYNCTRVWG